MRIPFVATLLLAAGCLTSGDDRLSVQINFQIIDPPATPVAPTIAVTGSLVQVQHHFPTPSPCYVFGTGATQSGSTIEMELRITLDQSSGCTGSATEWSYNALINGAKPGATRIGITIDGPSGQNRQEYALPNPTS
ncbi:MAG: hypothetical protein SFV24_17210 [Gemmatimonadales bacterium]|nr:hypothetical protein [Gemmatimonadota bacterium]MDX2059554.1 hypothetical protein [Gemmatimonadales bacterium]